MSKKIQTEEAAKPDSVMFSFAKSWVKLQFKLFSVDDFKEAYLLAGHPAPDDSKAFGGLFQKLAKNHLMFHRGFTKSKNKAARGRDVKTWISREYKLRQQGNASNKSTLKLEL